MENVLSLDELRDMSSDDYMNTKQLDFFQHMLESIRVETLAEIDACKGEITHSSREPDPVDTASYEDERARRLRFVDRKHKYIRKIDSTLERIRRKDYGYCDETGKAIGIERLLLRPTATLSVEAKRLQEAKEIHFSEEER